MSSPQAPGFRSESNSPSLGACFREQGSLLNDESPILQCNLALESNLSLNRVIIHKRTNDIFRIERQCNFETDPVDVPVRYSSKIYDNKEDFFIACRSSHSPSSRHEIELYLGESTVNYRFATLKDQFTFRQALLGRERVAEETRASYAFRDGVCETGMLQIWRQTQRAAETDDELRSTLVIFPQRADTASWSVVRIPFAPNIAIRTNAAPDTDTQPRTSTNATELSTQLHTPHDQDDTPKESLLLSIRHPSSEPPCPFIPALQHETSLAKQYSATTQTQWYMLSGDAVFPRPLDRGAVRRNSTSTLSTLSYLPPPPYCLSSSPRAQWYGDI